MARPLIAVVAAVAALAAGTAVVLARHGSHAARRVAASAERPASIGASTTMHDTAGVTAATVPPSAFGSRVDGAVGTTTGCAVVDDGTTTVYSRNGAASFAPASTQKLLVAAAALSLLGPAYRFTTSAVAPAPPQDGTVTALWLVGGGDGLLSSPEFIAHVATDARADGLPLTPLATLAASLAASGVRAVDGPIHGDASRYRDAAFLPTWNPTYHTEQDIGLLSALTLNEGLQQWKPVSKLAADPAAFAASELGRLLVGRGVSVAGPFDDGTAPPGGAVVAQVSSAPLSQIISAMLRASDNLIAELLVRELDRHAGGAGTTAGGTRLVLETDARLGLPLAGVHLIDGSGLDDGDRATCTALLAAMDLGGRSGFSAIGDGLAVAGQSGTLVHRFVGTSLAGRLAAKTGWIDNVAGMVGRLQVPAGRTLRFALLVNQPMHYVDAVAIEDHFLDALMSYSPS